jgi:hypothetical protein
MPVFCHYCGNRCAGYHERTGTQRNANIYSDDDQPMWTLRQIRLIGVFGVLLGSMLTAGCGFRALGEQDVVGTYEANADWGRSTLVLHPDHSFDQTVVRNDHTQVSTKGTWQLNLFAGKNASHGIIVLQSFLAIDHDDKGDSPGWAAPSINRGFMWGITIAADPDWGISFDKK